MSEEKRIMDFMGINQIEGNVRGEHLGKILIYLKTNTDERLDRALRILPLLVGMSKRYLKENYLEGILELGIIKIYHKNNLAYYKWFGEKAFNGDYLIPTEPQEIMKHLNEENTKDGLCPNCGKELPKNKKYCNEDCLRGYMKKRKGEK